MRQSIDDGVTLEIVYEGRTHNAEVADQAAMDAAFADVFSDYNLQERLADSRLRHPRRLSGSGPDHQGQGQGHGRPLPHPRVPQRVQGPGRRHVARGGSPLQDAHRQRT